MSTPHPEENTDQPVHYTTKRETADGVVFWGDDIDAERFSAAMDRFPVLAYVLQTYFETPVTPSREAEFLDRYEQHGEETREFKGLSDELDDAVKRYNQATTLINGILGAINDPQDVRDFLADFDDQIHHRGDWDPEAESKARAEAQDRDKYGINTAHDRVKATAFHPRAVPFGLLGGREFPLIYYVVFGVAVVLLGLGLTFIPIIGRIGILFILVGGVIVFAFGYTILSMLNDYKHPERERQREEFRKKRQEEKAEKTKTDGESKGFLTRINPFKS